MKHTTNDITHANMGAGEDNYGHFTLTDAPTGVLTVEKVSELQENIAMSKKFLFADTDTK